MERLIDHVLQSQIASLSPQWQVQDEQKLIRHFSFPDFAGALAWANQLGEYAETQNHHPDLFLAWGKLEITLWTHDANGITMKDIQFAQWVDQHWQQ